jgi:undecaprenyl-diphosphatase
MKLIQIILLALIQGMAELLPVSSSAHVIVAEKLMGMDPSKPEMTFLLVMLHTGTMLAVLIYFWPRWKKLKQPFYRNVLIATVMTGIVGLGLKILIEKVILGHFLHEPQAEIEHLFKSLKLMSASLFVGGILILFAGFKTMKISRSLKGLTQQKSILIGIVQGLCLPFRGFSRSGATISVALLRGISRELAEDFSFALAVLLTPPVILLEFYRLWKAMQLPGQLNLSLWSLVVPSMLGMVFSFLAGLLALCWLSSWLEKGRWKYFGGYCLFASGVVLVLSLRGW